MYTLTPSLRRALIGAARRRAAAGGTYGTPGARASGKHQRNRADPCRKGVVNRPRWPLDLSFHIESSLRWKAWSSHGDRAFRHLACQLTHR